MRGLRLLLATGNPGKVAEFAEALPGVTFLSTADVSLGAFPPEAGSSYDENALIKASFAAAGSGLPALADDSGIEVDALGGEPGIHSARFGGDVSDGERIALLLRRLRDVPDGQRGARFVCSLVLALPDGNVHVFRGETRGSLLHGPRGRGGFGYDPVFFSPELGRSFSEAGVAEKRRVSHRGRAIRRFGEWLETPAAAEALRPWTDI